MPSLPRLAVPPEWRDDFSFLCRTEPSWRAHRKVKASRTVLVKLPPELRANLCRLSADAPWERRALAHWVPAAGGRPLVEQPPVCPGGQPYFWSTAAYLDGLQQALLTEQGRARWASGGMALAATMGGALLSLAAASGALGALAVAGGCLAAGSGALLLGLGLAATAAVARRSAGGRRQAIIQLEKEVGELLATKRVWRARKELLVRALTL